MRRNILLMAIQLLILLLANCTLPATSSMPQPGLTIFEPVDGAVYQVNDMVQVRSQITSEDGAGQIDLIVNGELVRSDKPSPAINEGSLLQPWQPLQAGTYTLQIQLMSVSGAKMNSQSVTVQVKDSNETPAPSPITPVASLMPPSISMPVSTITFTPTSSAPMATAFQDANCRFGPGQAYNIIDALLNGESASIVGRNAETTWWVIQTKSGGTCWIWDGTVTLSGDTAGVPIMTAPPTPTFTPMPVPGPSQVGPSGQLTCRSTVFLEWSPVNHPNGISRYEWRVTGPGGIQSGSETNTQVEFFVSCGASYNWQVRAIDGNGNAGPYSTEMNFQIQ